MCPSLPVPGLLLSSNAHTCPHLLMPAHTCPHLSMPVLAHAYSFLSRLSMLTPAHACSYLPSLACAHTCPHLLVFALTCPCSCLLLLALTCSCLHLPSPAFTCPCPHLSRLHLLLCHSGSLPVFQPHWVYCSSCFKGSCPHLSPGFLPVTPEPPLGMTLLCVGERNLS